MLITTKGIVLCEREVGENDKIIVILSGEYGILNISVRGVKKMSSKNHASAQMFAYSKFCIDKKNNKYYLNSSEIIRTFYNLRLDIEKYALASYFAEVLMYTAQQGQNCTEVLRLLLNTFHFMEDDKHHLLILKSIFELRLMCELGVMPDLLACKNCGIYETDDMKFIINDGILLCRNCTNFNTNNNECFKLNKILLHSIRYIALSDFNKLWMLKINKNEKILNNITEKYLIYHLDRSFKTLDFYKSVVQNMGEK